MEDGSSQHKTIMKMFDTQYGLHVEHKKCATFHMND